MDLIVLVEGIADERAVDSALSGAYSSIRSDHDTARRRFHSAVVCTEVPDNIRAGFIERNAIQVAQRDKVAGKILGVDIEHNAHAVVLPEQRFKFAADVHGIHQIVGVDIHYQRLAGRNCTLCDSADGVVKGAADIHAGLPFDSGDQVLTSRRKRIQRSGDVELSFSRLRFSDDQVVLFNAVDLILPAAGNESRTVAVVGIAYLAVKAQDKHHFGACRKLGESDSGVSGGRFVQVSYKIAAHHGL